jgi:putative flippase GtrA
MSKQNLSSGTSKEHGITFKYSMASICGFVTDLVVLKISIKAGLPPAWARVLSLTTAMQVTFLINGLLIFRCLERRKLHLQWGGYMLTNAFGNLCNYLTFTTLLSFHNRMFSNHTFAVTVGALVAWVLNYTVTRFVVFRVNAPKQITGSASASTSAVAPTSV